MKEPEHLEKIPDFINGVIDCSKWGNQNKIGVKKWILGFSK